MCAWVTRSQQKARNGGGKGDNATPVMVTGRNTPLSCYTMSECSCLEWVCTKNVGFNFVQSELDVSVKWCNYDDSLQEKHTHPCLIFRAFFLLHTETVWNRNAPNDAPWKKDHHTATVAFFLPLALSKFHVKSVLGLPWIIATQAHSSHSQ